MKFIKVAIIGAGIAGISTAIELMNQTGLEITIFEAKSTIGGRVFSLYDNKAEEVIDNGKHLMVGAYNYFFALLKELNTFENLKFQDFLEIDFNDNRKKYRIQSGKYAMLSLLTSLLKVKTLKFVEKVNFIKFIAKLNQIRKGFSANHLTALDLLKKNKQNDNLIKLFWEPLILATMNVKPKEADAGIFLEILSQAFFSDIDSQKLVFSKVPLMELLSPMEKLINSKLKIRFSTLVKSIEKQKNGFVIDSDNREIFDAIVFAIPPNSLKKIIQLSDDLPENNLFKFFEIVEFSPIVSAYLWSKIDFLDTNFEAMIGTNFHWIFKEMSKGIRFTLTKSNSEELIHFSRNEILEMIYTDLEKLYPKFKREEIYHYQIIFEKNATIKLTPEIEEIRPAQRIENGLYLCGDWTNTKLPATMESAAKSGQLAARFLIDDFSS